MKIKSCFLFAKNTITSISIFKPLNFHLTNIFFSFKRVVIIGLILLKGTSYAQNFAPLTPRFDKDLKGDMLLIGNNILSYDNNNYDSTTNNESLNMNYVDIDGDQSTFNSSSANLSIPNPNCSKIVYAGLYWSAILQSTDRTNIDKVKLKLPNSEYNDIAGKLLYDSNLTPVAGSMPYACYADVTDLITSLNDVQGTYTVGNIITSTGSNGTTGLSAGWSLYIVYEDLSLTAKSITSFDGFSGITTAVGSLDISVNGFRTPPTGPVRAKFAFSALEGDKLKTGDYLKINNNTLSATNATNTTIRPSDNFFNSSISYINPTNGATENFTSRMPASTNTLGYDAGIIYITNPNNLVISNGATSATIRLGTASDTYFNFFNAVAVEIIEPKIVLTKQVFNSSGTDIGNGNVTLGEQLFYKISFQNIGNDAADNFTIKDVLPINILFDPADIVLPNGSGITFTYTPATRIIVFTIPKSLVEISDPRYEISFKVQVVPNCNDLSDVCSDKIQNQAFATYKGVINSTSISEDPSFSSFSACLTNTPSPTNFLVDVADCKFTKNYQLCGTDVALSAANGYSSYSWSTSPTGVPIIGNTQYITVSEPGTYYVHDTATAPCLSIDEVITVNPFELTTTNPVIPFADQIATCQNDGKKLPKLFLCNANATKLIRTGITDASAISWEKLDEASCPYTANDDCANENTSCTWTQVATGPDYSVNVAGQYRIVVNYDGGCSSKFYFNVFQNLLNPTITSKGVTCNSKGEITVEGVPPGYEYSLDPLDPFVAEQNVFSNLPIGVYSIYIKQTDANSFPCIFSVPGINIIQSDFEVTPIVSDPLCFGDKGSIKLTVNSLTKLYDYRLFRGTTLVSQVGPTAVTDYTFSNLIAGTSLSPITYRWEVSTDDGCLLTGSIDLKEPNQLSTSVVTKSVTQCSGNGEITVNTTGGTSPYMYALENNVGTTITSAQNSNIFPELAAGSYNIRVTDWNGCMAIQTNIIISQNVPLNVVATVTSISCTNTTGIITAIATGGQTPYTYSIGNSYQASTTFTGLTAGNYTITVKDALGCLQMITITLSQPSPLNATTVITKPLDCINYAEVTVDATGGVSPYNYSKDGGITYVSNNVFTDLPPGTYSIYARDSNGCITSNTITIAPLKPLIATITKTDVSCKGNTDGSINVITIGGSSYAYSLNGSAYQVFTNSNNILLTNLTAGNHFIKIKDLITGCETVFAVSITEPTVLTTTVIIDNQTIIVNASGGSEQYYYSLDGINFQTNNIFSNLVKGTYSIYVKDSNGCITEQHGLNINLMPLLSASLSVAPITCSNPKGKITVIGTGGVAPYLYSIDNGKTYVSSNLFTNLNPGVYTINIKDTQNSTVTILGTISTFDPLNATAVLTKKIDCSSNASIDISAVGGSAPYQYSMNGGAFGASNLFTNLKSGTYRFTVKDSGDCTVLTNDIILDQPASLIATLESKGQAITINAQGGTGIIKYAISPNLNTFTLNNTFTNLAPGIYTITAQDENGCSVLLTSTINPPAPLVNGKNVMDFIFKLGQTLADIIIDLPNIKWYIKASASTTKTSKITESELPLTTVLVEGTTYYASQTINGVESTERLAVTTKLSSLGTNDFDITNFVYYPNPVKNVLTLSNTSTIDEVTLTTIKGETILTKKINALRSEIDLSNLSGGVYFLKVISDGTEKTMKIIKE